MSNNGRGGRAVQPPPAQQHQQAAPRPVHEVRIGRVKAAVWANEGEHGVRYRTTVCRVYKDHQGRWQTTESFDRDDLLVLAKVADLAHTWTIENGRGQDGQ